MKGQGLSITTIVVAAIALLILVVLVAVFTGQFSKFSEGVNSCASRGGELKSTCSAGISLPGNWESNQKCCMNVIFNNEKKKEEKDNAPATSPRTTNNLQTVA